MLKFVALLCVFALIHARPFDDSSEFFDTYENPAVKTYSAFVQPAVNYGVQYYRTDDDDDFDDHRFVYAAQPQVVTKYRAPVTTQVEPKTYFVKEDRFDFDDDDYKGVHFVQPQPAVVQPQPAVQRTPSIVEYSANSIAKQAPVQPITKSATHQVYTQNVPVASYYYAHDFDDNSGEMYRSFGTFR